MSQVFGLVRFSYLPAESTGFALTGDRRFDERRRLVHDPTRLQQRMRLFERICLPSLAAQPTDRFAGLVLTSDKLPKPFADRLKKPSRPLPTSMRRSCRRSPRRRRSPPPSPICPEADPPRTISGSPSGSTTTPCRPISSTISSDIESPSISASAYRSPKGWDFAGSTAGPESGSAGIT